MSKNAIPDHKSVRLCVSVSSSRNEVLLRNKKRRSYEILWSEVLYCGAPRTSYVLYLCQNSRERSFTCESPNEWPGERTEKDSLTWRNHTKGRGWEGMGDPSQKVWEIRTKDGSICRSILWVSRPFGISFVRISSYY